MKSISVHNLSKQYHRSGDGASYQALRDILSNPFGKKKTKRNSFFALQDISFEIEQGSRIGIIGRNGAGKSTLLKILSRITPPTNGRILLQGRVASLLEVGTGFHPELTGRENIFLNGSILGLRRAEINRKFDEILQFSGVEPFIDMPLKQYSSGMQLRLAFSVAAHLEPEILMIDEVLAVGDLEFQKKCLGKMEEVSRSGGRTVLFVSHSMDAIRKFCDNSLLLDRGRLLNYGPTPEVIQQYVASHLQTSEERTWKEGIPSPDNSIQLNRVFLHDADRQVKSRFDATESIGVTMEYEVLREGPVFTHGLNVFNQENINIFDSHDVVSPVRNERRKAGRYSATVWIPGNLMQEGLFSIGAALFSQQPFHVYIHEKGVLTFEIFNSFSQPSARGDFTGNYGGLVRPLLQWETKWKTGDS